MEHQESLLSVAEAAKVLGVSPKILKERIEKGEIKTMPWGKQVRIPRWYLKQWQEQQMH